LELLNLVNDVADDRNFFMLIRPLLRACGQLSFFLEVDLDCNLQEVATRVLTATVNELRSNSSFDFARFFAHLKVSFTVSFSLVPAQFPPARRKTTPGRLLFRYGWMTCFLCNE